MVCLPILRQMLERRTDGNREKVCEFCAGLPKPMLIKRAEKPEYFMDMTEANIIKPSQEVAIMEGTNMRLAR